MPREIAVPFGRVAGWIQRYDARHEGTAWTVRPDEVRAESPDGARACFAVPFRTLDRCDLPGLVSHLDHPWQLGVVLVRRGGFAVAHVVGPDVAEAKIGRRHVQGRTKAGGWSQQRFARRRDNQAREAFEAAAGHTRRILAARAGQLHLLVVGGDRPGVQAVLDDRQLAGLAALPQLWVAGLPDPRRSVLDDAVTRARSVLIEVEDPLPH